MNPALLQLLSPCLFDDDSPVRYPYMGADSYFVSSTAIGAAFEAAMAGAEDVYVSMIYQADTASQADTVLRSLWASMRSDGYGVTFNGRDFGDGSRYRSAGASTATPPTYTVYTHSLNGPELIDGSIHLFQHIDVASGANGTPNCRVDAGSNVALTAAYPRANLGTVDTLHLGGENRSAAPLIAPSWGWFYAAIVAKGVTVAEGATIAAAYVAALAGSLGNIGAAYAAQLAAVEAAVSDPATDILFAQLMSSNTPNYGTTLTPSPSGISYVPAGVIP